MCMHWWMCKTALECKCTRDSHGSALTSMTPSMRCTMVPLDGFYLRLFSANASIEDRPKKNGIGTKLLQNLMITLKSLLSQPSRDQDSSEPAAKRIKTEHPDEAPIVNDPYKIWVGQSEEPPRKEGAILVQLTSAGIVNALAAIQGGLVDAKLLFLDPTNKLDSLIPSASNIPYKELRFYAMALHRVVQTRLEADFLLATPSRIIDMLAAELAPHEFSAVRRRVHETVIEGRGRNQGGADEADDLPVASRTAEHDIERVSGEICILPLVHNNNINNKSAKF
jgi:hypothetical protein